MSAACIRNALFAKKFTEFLNAWCERTGKNQKCFADRIGVYPSSVTDWKSGREYPSQYTMKRILMEFGVTLEEMHKLGIEDHIRMAYEEVLKDSDKVNAKYIILHTVADLFRDIDEGRG